MDIGGCGGFGLPKLQTWMQDCILDGDGIITRNESNEGGDPVRVTSLQRSRSDTPRLLTQLDNLGPRPHGFIFAV